MADRTRSGGTHPEASPSPVERAVGVARAEKIKLTAAYLNTAAGGFFTAGVVAPLAAAMFGIAGPVGSLPALTLVIGVAIFLTASVEAHIAGRIVLKGLDR